MAQTSGLPDTPFSPLIGAPQGDYGIPLAQWLMNGGQPYREPAAGTRIQATGTITPSSGVELMTAMPMIAGDVITNISVENSSVLTMGTNADGHLWFSLRNALGGLILQTADQGGSATWISNTWKTLALASGPYTVPTTGIYYVGQMQNIGTGGSPAISTLRGTSNTSTLWGSGAAGQPPGQKSYGYTEGTSLGGTAPSAPSLAVTANWFYCVAS